MNITWRMIVLESDRVKSQIVHPDVQLRAQRQSSSFWNVYFHSLQKRENSPTLFRDR